MDSITSAHQSFACADEAVVQDARAKAAAAGVPSSEPMTLEELEAVQAKMAAKRKHDVPTMPNDFLSEAAPFTDAAFRDVASTTRDNDVARQADGDGATSSHAAAADARLAPKNLQELPAESPEADGNSLAEDTAEGDADLAAVKVNMKVFQLCTNCDAQACESRQRVQCTAHEAVLMKQCDTYRLCFPLYLLYLISA